MTPLTVVRMEDQRNRLFLFHVVAAALGRGHSVRLDGRRVRRLRELGRIRSARLVRVDRSRPRRLEITVLQ